MVDTRGTNLVEIYVKSIRLKNNPDPLPVDGFSER